ncbi:neutral zinc metallopeptidase [Streptosporangium sp. NPDC000396]|uniref:neutral zinc metallopeptidase n=1 Tax=Streptosporangium sp. NPDC000396 TaxID=3366185 RepID=UPI0036A09DAA
MPYGQPPPPWQPQRARSRGGAGAIIGGIFGVVALVFVGLVVVGALIKSSHRSDPISPVAIPTFTPLERPTFARTDEPTPAESESSSEPTATHSSEPTEDTVDPPAKQVLNTSVKNNTLYRTGGLPKIYCPAGSASIYNHSQFKALILKASRCLDKGWSQIMSQQGIPWRRPGYVLTASRGRGACGDFPPTGSTVPYYCPQNYTIYGSTTAMTKGYGSLTDWHGGLISAMAHEYGHHIQELSGISNSWWQQTLHTSGTSAKLALGRRHELQATCFAGMFMRSVSASYPVTPAQRNILYYFYSQVGDGPGHPRDHGTPTNNNRWFRQGFEKNQTFQCNTWLAPSSTTS